MTPGKSKRELRMLPHHCHYYHLPSFSSCQTPEPQGFPDSTSGQPMPWSGSCRRLLQAFTTSLLISSVDTTSIRSLVMCTIASVRQWWWWSMRTGGRKLLLHSGRQTNSALPRSSCICHQTSNIIHTALLFHFNQSYICP